MLQKCFGESTLSRTQVFEWHKAFSESREVIENLSHARRPTIFVNNDNIEKVKGRVLENAHVGIRALAEDLNIYYGLAQHILSQKVTRWCLATQLSTSNSSNTKLLVMKRGNVDFCVSKWTSETLAG